MNTRGKALGRLAILLVVLAVAALAVAGVFGSRMNKKDSAGFRADLSGFESAAYARAGNGFAAVSGVSCRLYGANGDVLQTVSRSYSDVQIVGAEGCAAVWSEGGTGLTLLIGEQAKDLTFSGGVTGVDINDECTAAVLAGENGYKGSVSVYNGSGDGIYRVYVGSGYPVDAAVSPDSRSVAILSLTAEGSAVSVYRLDSEKVAAEYLEEIVASGQADVVELARGLICDPDLPRKAREGRGGDVTKCMRCFTCFSGLMTYGQICCALNPEIGSEFETNYAVPPAEK